MRTSIHQLAEHPRVHDLRWPVVVEVTVLLAIDRPAERHRHLVAPADVAGPTLRAKRNSPSESSHFSSDAIDSAISPMSIPVDASSSSSSGGLVQRFGTSRLMDHSGIEKLDRNGEPWCLRQACVGSQEWTADNLRQGDIRRVVRGEVGTP